MMFCLDGENRGQSRAWGIMRRENKSSFPPEEWEVPVRGSSYPAPARSVCRMEKGELKGGTEVLGEPKPPPGRLRFLHYPKPSKDQILNARITKPG